jgi:hypothetical protein
MPTKYLRRFFHFTSKKRDIYMGVSHYACLCRPSDISAEELEARGCGSFSTPTEMVAVNIPCPTPLYAVSKVYGRWLATILTRLACRYMHSPQASHCGLWPELLAFGQSLQPLARACGSLCPKLSGFGHKTCNTDLQVYAFTSW